MKKISTKLLLIILMLQSSIVFSSLAIGSSSFIPEKGIANKGSVFSSTHSYTANHVFGAIATNNKFDDPIPVDAGPDASVCEGGASTVIGSINGLPVGSAGTWSTTSGSGFFSLLGDSSLHTNAWDGINGIDYNVSINDTGKTIYLVLTGPPNGLAPAEKDSIALTVYASVSVTLDAVPNVCIGSTTITIPIASTAGSPDTYTVNPGFFNPYPGFTSATGTLTSPSITITISGAAPADSYDFDVVLSNTVTNCNDGYNSFFVIVDEPTPVDAGPDASVCEDGTITVYGEINNQQTGYSGTWSTTSGTGIFSSTAWDGINGVDYTPSAGDVGNVIYLVLTGPVNGGCPGALDSIELTVNANPTITLDPTPVFICEGATTFNIPYTATTGSPDTYTVIPGTNPYPGFVSETGALIGSPIVVLSISGTEPAGVYDFDVLVSNSVTNCISSLNSFQLNVEAATPVNAGPDAIACEGSATTVTGEINNSGFGYVGTWSTTSGNGFFSLTGDPGTPTNVWDGIDGIDYNTDISDTGKTIYLVLTGPVSGTCAGAIDSLALTVYANPTITLDPTSTIICQTTTTFDIPYSGTTGSPDEYTVSPGNNPYPGFVSVTGTLSGSPISVTVSGVVPAGTYDFDVVVNNTTTNCASSLSSFQLNVDTFIVVDAGPDAAICEGGTATVYGTIDNGSIGYLGTWSTTSGAGFFSVSGNPGIPTNVWDGINGIDYNSAPGDVGNTIYLVLTGPSNGTCPGAIDSLAIIIYPTPAISFTVDNVCDGAASFTIPYTVTAANPDLYSIDVDNGGNPMPSFVPVVGASLTGSPITVVIPNGTAPGTYDFTLSVIETHDPSQPCESSLYQVQVTIYTNPDLSTTPLLLCFGGTVDLNDGVTDLNATIGIIAFYPTLADAQNETNSISSIVNAVGTYYVRKNTSTIPSCFDIDSISVYADDIDPVITCPNDTIVNCEIDNTIPANTGGSATATDNCDLNPTIGHSDLIVPSQLCLSSYTITRTWTATDGYGNVSSCVQTITVQDTTKPVISCPSDITIQCTADTSIANTSLATATDNCSNITITWSNVKTDGNCAGNYSIARTFVATDDCGNASSCTQTITVIDTVAPIISCPQNLTIQCTADTSSEVNGSATATDNCSNATITRSDVKTNGNCAGNYTIARTFVATDDCGNASSCTQTITVIDTVAPIISCPQDVTIQCTADTSITNNGLATAIDNCSNSTVTWSDVQTNGNCAGNYSLARTFVATDDCGNASSCTQTITVIDTVAPIISCPQDVTIQCTADTSIINNGLATAIDNCSNSTVTWSDVKTNGNCAGNYTIARTFVATDDCGNASSCAQTITVIDTVAPNSVCQNLTVALDPQTGAVSITASQIDDGSTDNCSSIILGVSPNSFDCSNVGANTVVLTVTDECGNSSTCNATVTVTTDMLVTITADAPSICASSNLNLLATATGGNLSYSYSWTGAGAAFLNSTTIANPIFNNPVFGSYALTVTVTDGNGCSATDSYTVIVNELAIVALTQDSVNCNEGLDGSITASGSLGLSPYDYTISPDPNSQSFTDEALPVTFTGLTAGNYVVTITDMNGCTGTTGITVLQPDAILPFPSVLDSITCNNLSDGSVTANPTGGNLTYFYSWTNSSSIVVGTTQTVSGLPSDVYTVVVTDQYGCSGTDSVTLINPDLLFVALDSVTNVQCFGYATGAIYITVTGGTLPYTYLWNNGFSTQNLTNLVAGIYECLITDFHGCTDFIAVEVTENPQVVVGTAQTNVTCYNGFDGTATVYVNGGIPGYSYLWDNGNTTLTAYNLTVGLHTVTISDNSGTPGCDTSITFLITQPPLLDATVNVIDVVCHGSSNGVATVFPFGGTGSYSYSWNSIPVQTTQTATGLPAGNYVCTILDSLGCNKDVVVEVNQPDSLYIGVSIVPVSCNGGNNGSITVSPVGGVPAYSYEWSDGQTTATADSLVAGTYVVTVTDFNLCKLIQAITVNENSAFTYNVAIDNVICYGGNSGMASVTVSGGVPPYVYLWNTNPAQTSNTATGLIAGDYTLIVTDSLGCSGTQDVTITQADSIALNEEITNPVCNGQAGFIDLNITGGVGPYTIIWSNGNTTQNNSGLLAGSYTVTVVDANGCIITQTYTITEPSAIVVTGTITNASCFGNANGSITASATGGTPGYTYYWSTGETTETISNLPAATYTVYVFDNNSCLSIQTFDVTQPLELTCVCDANITNVSCFGGNNGSVTALPSGGVGPYSYSWIMISPSISGVLATTQTISGLTAGTYEVTITDANGCVKVGTSTITQPDLVTVTATAANVNCNGAQSGTATATPAGGVPPFTYSWNSTPVQTTQIATGLGIGTYTVVTTDSHGCSATASVVITSSPALVATTTKTNVSCKNGNNGTATVTVSGGSAPYTYLWSNGSTNSHVTGLIAGTYTVTVTDSFGCTISKTVTIGQRPAISTLYVVTNPTCYGSTNGSINITVAGGTPPYTFAWSTGATTEDLIGVVSAGAYSVYITDSLGCVKLANIIVNQPNPLVVTISTTSVSCNGGGDGKATANVSGGSGPYTYLWSNGKTTKTINNLSAIAYTVTVTDKKLCTSVLSITIPQPTALSCFTTLIQPAGCTGANKGKASVTPIGGTPGYTYLWNTNPIKTTAIVNNLAAGIYTVIVTDKKGCTSSCTVTVTQTTPVVLNASVVNNVSCNGGADGSAIVNVTGGTPGYSYLWNTGVATTTANANGLAAGLYTVTVTDTTGCSTSASVLITQPTAITASYLQTNVNCNGNATGSITVNASGGTGLLTYTLNPGNITNGTNTFSALAAGTYDVIVSDVNGCSLAINSIVLTAADPLTMEGISGTNINCFGGSNGTATAGTISGGTLPYTYNWNSSPSQATATATGLSAGTYIVVVTDVNGCTVTNSITLTEPQSALTVAIVNVQNIPCNGGLTGSATALAQGGTGAYLYLWSDGQTDATAIGLIAGLYAVTVTDENGCQATTTVVISEPVTFEVSATGTDASCNGAANGSIVATVIGGTAPFTYVIGNDTNTTGIFSNLAAGNYLVEAFDTSGCNASILVTLLEPGAIIANTTTTDVSCNEAADGTATVYAAGGVAPYSYLWGNGSTGQVATGLAAGLDSVIITDANGCSIMEYVTLTEPNPLVITPSQVDVACVGGNSGSATATVAGGTAPYFYMWSNNQMTQTATGLSAGSYSVIVIDYNGCLTEATFEIIENDSIQANATINAALCYGDSSEIILNPTGGCGGPYTYEWISNPSNTTNIEKNTGGMTYVKITDACGCTRTICIATPSISPYIAVSNGTNPNCSNTLDGTLSAAVIGGTPPYLYAWSNGESTDVVTGVGAGTYSVVITDDNGCILTSTVTLTAPDSLIANVSVTNETCGNANGTATVTATGGTTPYTYLWDDGETTASIANLAAGTYSVTVSDANGCGPVEITFIIGASDPLTSTISSVNASCAGYQNGQATVTALGGTSPYTYFWNSAPVQTTQTAVGLGAGFYEVVVTDGAGCTSVSVIEITEPTPLSSFVSQTNINCNGYNSGSATVIGYGGTPYTNGNPYTYLWNDGQTTATVTGLVSGTYIYTITDSLGCTTTGTVSIVQPSSMSCNVNTTPAYCGQAVGTAIVNVYGGLPPYSYNWATLPAQTNAIATDLVAGVYSVTVTDANGCQTQCTGTVYEPGALTYVITGTQAACNGGNGTLSVFGLSGGTAPYLYAWSNGDTTSTISAPAGSYSVVVTDANGCSKADTASITEPTAVSLAYIQNNVTCNGNNNGSACVIPSGGVQPYTYLWSNGIVLNCVSSLAPGTYTVIVTDFNGCPTIGSVLITEPSALDTISTSATVASCGLNDGTACVIMTGGTPAYTYAWNTSPVQTTDCATGLAGGNNFVTVTDANGCQLTVCVKVPATSAIGLSLNAAVYAGGVNIRCNGGADGSINLTVNGTGPFTFIWSNQASTEDIFGLTAGTYSVIVSNGSCTSTASITLTEASVLSAITSQTNVSCFGANNGSATVTAIGGTAPYTYSWNTVPVKTTMTATGLTAGNYIVTVSDANGCTAIAVVDITQPLTALAITSNSSNPTCYLGNNGLIDITVSGGTMPYTYIWNDGSTDEDRTDLFAGSHTVTVTDANGCVVSLCVVLVAPNPIQVTVSKSNVSCNGGINGSACAAATGGVAPYAYLWTDGSTTSCVNNLFAGSYSVTVTDANGCSIETGFTITSPDQIILTTSKTDVTVSGGNDGTASVSVVSGGVAPFTYAWNTSPIKTTASVTGLVYGTYQVTVTDANGCVAVASVAILQPNYFCNPVTRPWRTESIVTWGVAANGNPTQSGQYLTSHFVIAFPSSLVVGGGCVGSKTLTLANATAVRNFLNGQPNTLSAVLGGNLTNPTSTTYKNKLAAQVVALTLNVRFDLQDPNFAPLTTVWLGDAIITGMTGATAVFNGLTVTQFLNEANKRLGNCTAVPSATPAVWADAAETINLSYVGGVAVNSGLLTCPAGNNKVMGTEVDSWSIAAYPNPTSGIINVAFAAEKETTITVDLMDVAGRSVWNTTEGVTIGENVRIYDFSAMPQGIYMMNVKMDDHSKIVRIIIQ